MELWKMEKMKEQVDCLTVEEWVALLDAYIRKVPLELLETQYGIALEKGTLCYQQFEQMIYTKALDLLIAVKKEGFACPEQQNN